MARTLILLFLLSFAAGPLLGQQPTPSENAQPSPPRAEVHDVAVLPNGGLLFAVRLFAASNEKLKLYRPPKREAQKIAASEEELPPEPLSLATSRLKDTNTGKEFKPYPILPPQPFVGPIQVAAELSPGGWIQLGVAFPPLPPPLERDGEKQPYQLLFSVPELQLETPLLLDPETKKIVLQAPQ